MQAHTKMHHTDDTHVLVVACPKNSFDNVMAYLKKNGCTVNDATYYDGEYVLHEEAFSDSSPGNRLRGLRWRDDLTREELSRLTGISQCLISEMENNKSPIVAEIAHKLGKVFNIDPRIFGGV